MARNRRARRSRHDLSSPSRLAFRPAAIEIHMTGRDLVTRIDDVFILFILCITLSLSSSIYFSSFLCHLSSSSLHRITPNGRSHESFARVQLEKIYPESERLESVFSQFARSIHISFTRTCRSTGEEVVRYGGLKCKMPI